jgi:hypothetical protein
VLNSKWLATSLRRTGNGRVQKFADENPVTAAAMECHWEHHRSMMDGIFFTQGCRFATD